MQPRHAHFIGIGGIGMSATAKLLKDGGAVVSGSDEDVYPPVSDFLKREQIQYRTPYAADNFPPSADLIVIGKTAKLIPDTNAEVAAAFASGKRIMSFPEVLGELSKGKETIVVAGSYGKSTTAAILVHCLENSNGPQGARHNPSFFIGAIPATPRTSARMGTGNIFVLEGDEYPSSNTDARSKFLHYHPQHLLITPLAHDHFNVFPTPNDYLRPFEQLATLPPARATIVACVDGGLSRTFLSRVSQPIITYGFHEGDFHAANVKWGETTSFSIKQDGAEIARIETNQLGEHNIQNIVGVSALMFSRKLSTAEQFGAAISSFQGVKRRLERKSKETTIPIYESFGSSYEKARSDIAAIRRHFPSRRLLIVFEPHTFSWRNREALSWYDDVFTGATKVFVYEPPSHGAAMHAQASQREIVDRVRIAGIDADPISDPDKAVFSIESAMQSNDVILMITSGHLGGLIERISPIAEQKFGDLRAS